MIMRQILYYIPIAGFAAWLIISGIVACIAAWKGLRSKAWSHTVGQVVEFNRKGFTYKRVKVVYTYTVYGVEYRGKKIAFGYGIISHAFLMRGERLAQYRDSKEVTVYYNPNDPSQAVLEPGTKDALSTLLFGLVIVVFGLLEYFL